MDRRIFLAGAASVAASVSSVSSAVLAAARPCPPKLMGAAARACPLADSQLADACRALAAGESVNFTKNTLQRENDIQWQVLTIWYDAARHELQYMGKPASGQSTDYSHYVYDELSDSWWTSGQSLFPGIGHIWDVTFDPVNGDYWFRKYNKNALWQFDRSEGSNGTWKRTVEQTSPALNNGNANFGAMGWHPNLFGAGMPGIFIWAPFRFFAYNLATKEFSVLNPTNFSTSDPFWNRSTGQAIYLPATDQLICFAQNAGNGDPAIIVEPGAGNSSDIIKEGLVKITSEPPISVWGGGGTTNHGHVVPHPNDPNRLLLLDEHGTSRVWESTDHGSTWNLMGYQHPFQAMVNWSEGEYTVGVIEPHGVVIGMTSTGDGGETVLWKPSV